MESNNVQCCLIAPVNCKGRVSPTKRSCLGWLGFFFEPAAFEHLLISRLVLYVKGKKKCLVKMAINFNVFPMSLCEKPQSQVPGQ